MTAIQPSRGGNTPAEKIRYRGKTYYLDGRRIYDSDMNLLLEDVENGFLDLYEYFEYFESTTNIQCNYAQETTRKFSGFVNGQHQYSVL